jgi:alkaline phosphatase D
MKMDRRNFLRIAGTIYVSAGLPISAAAAVRPGAAVSFPHGVASGDPQPDSVLLWTRAHSALAGDLSLVLQVSASEDFASVIIEEPVTAEAANDHTIRAHVAGLHPAQHYYYRFLAADGGYSRVGRTRTAPAPDSQAPVHLAFASCQNYEQGFFGAWSRMITEDAGKAPGEQIEFVLHLGDFIYERYLNRQSRGQTFARLLPEFPDGATDGERVWADSLADYRHLYKSYLEDPHLQAARARWPFICTWDDHEFSNDGFQHFSTYTEEHKPERQRLRNAHKAWFEYIPAQVPQREELQIYRQLRWGAHVDLLITDLRSYRSAPPLPSGMADELGMPMDASELVAIYDSGRDYNNGAPPEMLPFGDGTLPNTARDRAPGTMLGQQQKDWFKQSLTASSCTWKIWGNSLPILPLRMDLSSLPFAGMHDSILSQDAWAGFPQEYRELMSWVGDQDISGVVSLSGDHHMHGAATLVLDPDLELSPAVAVDFNVSGISSTPHFNNVLYSANKDNSDFMQLVATQVDGQWAETWNMSLHQGVLASLAYDKSGLKSLASWLGPNSANPGLSYVDTNSNGYGLASFDAKQCQVELVTVVAPLEDSDTNGSHILRRARFKLLNWEAGQQASLVGPEFEGQPPFPW